MKSTSAVVRRLRPRLIMWSLLITSSFLLGCEQRPPRDANTNPAPAASPWHAISNSTVVAVDDQAIARELAAAAAEARSSAEQARRKWLAASAEERARWSIKWAAPIEREIPGTSGNAGTVPGVPVPGVSVPGVSVPGVSVPGVPGDSATDASSEVEHVWIVPLHWSAFRIEGLLVSDPMHRIAGGRQRGDLVSFPIEELSDWALFAEPGIGHEKSGSGDLIEGGFTLRVLQKHYGAPPTGR